MNLHLEILVEEPSLKESLLKLLPKILSQETTLVINRIVVEELEAWFFGDPVALHHAYPKLPQSLTQKARYRIPDQIAGGTWEALEQELQRVGYFMGGLPKIEVAKTVSQYMEPQRNSSASFQLFYQTLLELKI